MTKERICRDLLGWGIVATLITAAMPEYASAITISGVGNRILSNMTNMPHIVSAVAYIGGGILGISGALKLKAHAEKPDQEKIAPGIMRLLVGSSLVALPALMSTINTTTGVTGTVSYVPLLVTN
jgi:hypothetical protein